MSNFEESEFQGKVVAITGAGNGLSRSHAHEFAKRVRRSWLMIWEALSTAPGLRRSDLVVKEIEEMGGKQSL